MAIAPGKMFDGKTHYVLTSKNFAPTEPVVVCVHGIGSYSFHYDSLVETLKEHNYTILTYDLFGRGYSPFPTKLTDENGQSVFGGDGHVEQLRELIVGLGLHQRKYHIIGHSMGGGIVSLYSSKYGEQEVLSVTLLSAAGVMDLGPLKAVRAHSFLQGITRWSLRRGLQSAVRGDFYTHKGEALKKENDGVEKLLAINRQYPHIFEAFWLSVLHFPFHECGGPAAQLASYHHIPTLIMWADKDKAVPLKPCLQRWVDIYKTAGHPSVETKVFKNAAHGFFMEYSDECNADIVRFLQSGATKQSSI